MTEYTPHPGSRLDMTARAAAQETPDINVPQVTGEDRVVVGTAEQLPALGRGYVITLSASNPVLPLLPQDPSRRSAIVLAVDNDVYIASTREAAEGAAGSTGGTTAAYLPAGIAMPLLNKAAWYAAVTTTAATSRVTVIISTDGDT